MRELQDLAAGGASYFEKERKLDEALHLMGLTYSPGSQEGLPKVYYGEAMRMRVEDKMHQIHATAPTWVGHGGDPARLEAILREFERMMKLAMSEWDIHYKQSTDGGLTWTADRRLTDAPGLSQRPSIAMSADDLHVVWFDGRDNNEEIYRKHSSDAGMTWEEDMRLTDAPGESLHASVAALDRDVHLVWFDHRDGNPEIYYKRSAHEHWAR